MATPFQWRDVPVEVMENLSFTVGWWGYGSPPLSNGPFWSLSFECAYYALYGIWHYYAAGRWWVVPLLLLATGPSIALLAPVWLLGVLLHDSYIRLSGCKYGLSVATCIMLGTGLCLGVLRHSVVLLLRATSLSARRAALSRFIVVASHGRMSGQTLPWLDRLSVSYYVTGTALVVVLLPVLLALKRVSPAYPKRLYVPVRVVADATFPLYLLHEPYLLFCVCLHGGAFSTKVGALLLILTTMVISVACAAVCDRVKVYCRNIIDLTFPTA